MYKKILVPLDGSWRSERILPHVEGLALNFNSEIIFLRVLEPESTYLEPGNPQLSIDALKRRETEAREYLSGKSGEFNQKGLRSRIVIQSGPVAMAILDVASSEDVDLIGMASHGRSGLERVFYGSVASAVLQGVDRPLLLVRSRQA